MNAAVCIIRDYLCHDIKLACHNNDIMNYVMTCHMCDICVMTIAASL